MMRYTACLLVAGLALICVATLTDCQVFDGEVVNDVSVQPKSARTRFQVPKLFDFERFKSMFKKSYGSILEEMARKKIVLAYAFKSLIAGIKYKYGKITSFLRVNHLSDRTPDELDKMKPKISGIVSGTSGASTSKSKSDSTDEIIPAASASDIKEVLENLEDLKKGEPGYEEIIEELEHSSLVASRRRKRSVTSENSPDDAVIDKPTSPDHEPDEQSDDKTDTESSMSTSLIQKVASFPGASYLASLVVDGAKSLIKPEDNVVNEKLPDAVYVDHRESNCFFLVRDQGDCGSCYAFSAISLYEWDYCRQTGNKLAFSEQYLIDCGLLTRWTKGCDGAIGTDVLTFIQNYGLELRQNYPYVAKEGECSFNFERPREQVGYILQTQVGHKIIGVNEIDEYLPVSPVLIGIWLPSDFLQYGGGVDLALDCDEEHGGHAMLIVGSGREDGIDYYLIRNSHSYVWGEDGYYKLSKGAFLRCDQENIAMVSVRALTNETVHDINPNYSHAEVAKRSRNHMSQTLGKGELTEPLVVSDTKE